jgi:hypothetical protein
MPLLTWHGREAIFAAACCRIQEFCMTDAAHRTARTQQVGRRWWGACAAFAFGAFAFGAVAHAAGPDIVLKDINQVIRFGEQDGMVAYSFANVSCNIGNADLAWQLSGSPVMGLNMYRLQDGTLQHIGQSFAKRSLFAVASEGCGPCNGNDNEVLGAGCQDVYNAYYNGAAGNLGPRSTANAFTGAVAPYTPMTGNLLFRRLQVPAATVDPALNANALHFAEGVFVATDDAQAGNALNNASFKRIALQAGGQFVDVGETDIGRPAIYAWRDHGRGWFQPDESVRIVTVDVPGEGRFYVGSKARSIAPSLWKYEYAIFNLNSDQAAGGLEIGMSRNSSVSGVTFQAPRWHSGEAYGNDQWVWWRMGEGSLRLRTAQTHSQSPNDNAVRWGIMATMSFVSNAPPVSGQMTMHLFKPWPQRELPVSAWVPLPTFAGGCDSIDFDNDTLFPTDTDLVEYLAALAGAACPTCNDIDFNNDGIFPSDEDLIALLRVMAGGNC